jgi:hypothetical protein
MGAGYWGASARAQEQTVARTLTPETTSSIPAAANLWQPLPQRLFAFDPSKVDFSVGVYAQLLATRTTDTTVTTGIQTVFQEQTEGLSPSGGVLATFHQQFRGWVGYDVNFGFTRADEEHSVGTISTIGTNPPTYNYSKTADRANLYEFSLGYVVKAPTSSHRLQAFAEAGPGALLYQPAIPSPRRSLSVKAAVLIGAGADLRLSDHLGLRMEYRGLLTTTPDVLSGGPPGGISGRAFTAISEPTVSLKYSFGAHQKMQ